MAEKDEHASPANPDNRIGLERQAADREHEAQIAGATARRPGAGKARRTRAGREVVEVGSTGHSWDGIEEYDNPLPRWWLWTFYVTCVWALAYTIFYPAWPLVTGATQGLLRDNNRAHVEREIQRFADANAPIETKLVNVALDEIAADPELSGYAQNAGAAVFRTYCAQCHGSGAAGAKGYPNLLDNDWLWGGTLDDIHTTVLHGIRDPKNPDTRYSEMPKFGVDGLLTPPQITEVANYVLALGGKDHDAAAAEAGKTVFAENCVACHGEAGTGDRAQGAPNLTDAVWLYGDDLASVEKIISQGPFGVMPAWTGRLSEAQIRSVASYVHGLGGGE